MSENKIELLTQQKQRNYHEKVMCCCCGFEKMTKVIFDVLKLECLGLCGKYFVFAIIVGCLWGTYFVWFYDNWQDHYLPSVNTATYNIVYGIWEVLMFVLGTAVSVYFVFAFDYDVWYCEIHKKMDLKIINVEVIKYTPFNKYIRNYFVVISIITLIFYSAHNYGYWSLDVHYIDTGPYYIISDIVSTLVLWFSIFMSQLHISIILYKYKYYLENYFIAKLEPNSSFFDIRREYKVLYNMFYNETKLIVYYICGLIITAGLHTWSTVAKIINNPINFVDVFHCITGFFYYNSFPFYSLLISRQLFITYKQYLKKLDNILDSSEFNNNITMNIQSHQWYYDKLIACVKQNRFVLSFYGFELDFKSILLPLIMIGLQQLFAFSVKHMR